MTKPLLQPLGYGGQLAQASLAGRELFYLSPGPHQPMAARRGGVPVLFPQFGTQGSLAKHGFARNREWLTLESSSQRHVARLEIDPAGQRDWPYAATLTLTTFVDAVFSQQVRIENTGAQPFSFTGGLHPYWAVSDIASTVVSALSLQGLGERVVDEWHAVTGEVMLDTGNGLLRLSQQGFQGWQVWNPGREHELSDLPHADWRKFLCIEPVIMTPVTLAPGETFVGALQAAWVL